MLVLGPMVAMIEVYKARARSSDMWRKSGHGDRRKRTFRKNFSFSSMASKVVERVDNHSN